MSQIALDVRSRALERRAVRSRTGARPAERSARVLGRGCTRAPRAPRTGCRTVPLLEDLASAGAIELPAHESWDRSSRPPLPRFVSVPSARRSGRDRPWQRHPWRRELAFVASLPALSELQFAMLRRLETWLAGARQGDSVPARLRSAEIFGEEKNLDALERSPTLFGPGRITYDMLGVRRVAPPLYLERVAPVTRCSSSRTSTPSGPPSTSCAPPRTDRSARWPSGVVRGQAPRWAAWPSRERHHRPSGTGVTSIRSAWRSPRAGEVRQAARVCPPHDRRMPCGPRCVSTIRNQSARTPGPIRCAGGSAMICGIAVLRCVRLVAASAESGSPSTSSPRRSGRPDDRVGVYGDSPVWRLTQEFWRRPRRCPPR